MTQILFLLLFHITSLYTFECVDMGFFSSLILKYFLQVSWDKNLYFLILYLHSYSSAFNPVQNSVFHMIGSTPFQLGLGLGENYNGYDLLFCTVFFSIFSFFFFFCLYLFVHWSRHLVLSVNFILGEAWAKVILREILKMNTCCTREEIMRNESEIRKFPIQSRIDLSWQR